MKGSDMLLGDLLQLLRRYWLVVVVGVVLAGTAAVGTFAVIKPTYKATASVLVVPSVNVPGITTPVNPFQAFGNSTTQAGRILQIEITSPQSVQAVVDEGGSDKYTVDPNDVATGPVLDIAVESPSATMALNTVQLVIKKMGVLLDDRQREVSAPADTFLRLDTISSTPKAQTQNKAAIQAAIVVAIAVVVLTGVAILILERLSRRRTAGRIEPVTPGSPLPPAGRRAPTTTALRLPAPGWASKPRAHRPGQRRHHAPTKSFHSR